MFVTILLFLCALSLSGIAGYYSIIGMAAIFAGAFWPVVAMTGILELSKLVVSSWLYQKWEIIPFLIKTYLTIAVIVLMGITSLGIFGFLSKAHVDQNLDNVAVTLQIEQIDSKIANIKLGTDRYESQLKQLDRAIDIQLDEKRGVLAGQERKKQEQERNQIRQKLDDDLKSIQELQAKKVEFKQKMSVIESKVGPIRYVAEFFSDGKAVDLDHAIRWMILIIVFVFDPLAVLMIIAANIGFRNWSDNRKKKTLIPPTTQTITESEPEYIEEIIPFVPKPQSTVYSPPKFVTDYQITDPAPFAAHPAPSTASIFKTDPIVDNIVVQTISTEESLTDIVPVEHANTVVTHDLVEESSINLDNQISNIEADQIIGRLIEHRNTENPAPEISIQRDRGYKY